ncbi:hypothetical protein M758_7G029900 [Ceratodon purpureus]|nr:hypothetical protein M758_7G029900 [Ceratodon purpureus]
MAYPGYPQKAQSVQGQTLDVTVVGCFNLSDKEWFSRQDPYVVIDYSGQKFRTRTDTDGGRNPSFNEAFKLSLIEGLREVSASVWNSNTIERDDYIGTTKILLNKVIDSGYDDSQWQLTNSYTGKSAGVLKLILHYGGGKTKPGKNEANPYAVSAPPACYAQPAPAYGASHSHHYPPQQIPAPYPQVGGYCAPPLPVAPQAFVPVYQAAPQPAYPPQPVAYVAPPPPTQPAYYYPGAPAYPQAPPAAYPQPGYNPQFGRGL